MIDYCHLDFFPVLGSGTRSSIELSVCLSYLSCYVVPVCLWGDASSQTLACKGERKQKKNEGHPKLPIPSPPYVPLCPFTLFYAGNRRSVVPGPRLTVHSTLPSLSLLPTCLPYTFQPTNVRMVADSPPSPVRISMPGTFFTLMSVSLLAASPLIATASFIDRPPPFFTLPVPSRVCEMIRV